MKAFVNKNKEIAELREQLAEKEEKNLLLYSMLYETLEKEYSENVSSRINQMTGETLEKQSEWFKSNRICDELQKQLAEKDKEIEYYKKQAKKFNNEAQKYFEDAYCNDFQKQTKIDFAVEQLKKVKEMLQPYLRFDINLYLQTIKNINNQIKRLTHQHEDKGE